MFTVCPKCSLKLVVTAADLRVAQGYVRCGRCSNVFNALAGLSDEQQAALAQQQSRPAARTSAPIEPEPISSEPISAQDDEPISDASLEFDLASTDVSKVFIVPDPDDQSPTGTFESIVLETPEPPAPAEMKTAEALPIEFELDDSVVPESSAMTQQRPEEPPAPPPTPAPPAATAARSSNRTAPGVAAPAPATRAKSAPAPKTPAAGAAPRPVPQRPAASASVVAAPRPKAGAPAPQALAARRLASLRDSAAAVASGAARPAVTETSTPQSEVLRVLWRAGSVLLVLFLGIQLIHHYRNDLAGVGWLRGLYASIGMPLTPHWDLNAYEVHQLGAFAGPQSPGELTVRASVKNTGEKQQPLPLLRITVQDRFGNRMATRDVPPTAYLAAASAAHSYMEAGQRVDAEIAFVDPGPNAVGFEIDACLAEAAGRVACANDAGNR